MPRRLAGLAAVALVFNSAFADDPTPSPLVKERLALVDKVLDSEAKDLVALYQYLHSHPELSLQEEQTAARMAAELAKLGFDVTTKVGGHGVVGLLKNGP